MRNWIKTLLFFSAFSPCLLSMAFARYLNNSKINEVIILTFLGFLGLLCIRIILDLVKWKVELVKIELKKVESMDFTMLAVVASYFVPLVSRVDGVDIAIVVLVLAFVYILLWWINTAIPSPTMRLLGYRFYKVESATGMVYTLISGKEILDPTHVKDVQPISGSTIFVARQS